MAGKPILDAVTSDPAVMGWMKGAPPPPELAIDPAQGNHMRFPYTRWSFSHMREFLPTQLVSRGEGPASPLPRALRDDLDAVTFRPAGVGDPMRWDAGLLANFTDGVVILHKGAIVQERYFGVTGPLSRHIAFSVTKSFVGTLAEMLIDEGRLDETAPVSAYVPELADSGYGNATVRHVMDMTTGIDYSEDYTDPRSGIGAFSLALGLTPRPSGYNGPTSLYRYLPDLRGEGSHGAAFTYRTVNTEVLGWIVARIEGQRIADVLSRRIWQPLGMECDADLLTDSAGTGFTGGGLNPVLRDMARFGEAMRMGGRYNGAQVIPAGVVDSITRGGKPEDFARANYPQLPGWSYRSQWWVTHNAHGAFTARGIHGQTIYVDPLAEMVIARFASHPVAANSALDGASLPAYHAMGEYLRSAS
ncbi:serine hydrolase domain-containing protein [Novosphingobium tardum]|uniref:Serine hydrolase domain-containing protein n=1 Tax=Novosphingobium tardum TaxID=1538021 RepID=A0ABV8RQI5_9SPHN